MQNLNCANVNQILYFFESMCAYEMDNHIDMYLKKCVFKYTNIAILKFCIDQRKFKITYDCMRHTSK